MRNTSDQYNPERYVKINEEHDSVELFIPLRPYTGIELDDSCQSSNAYEDFLKKIPWLTRYLRHKIDSYSSPSYSELKKKCLVANNELRNLPLYSELECRKPNIYRVPLKGISGLQIMDIPWSFRSCKTEYKTVSCQQRALEKFKDYCSSYKRDLSAEERLVICFRATYDTIKEDFSKNPQVVLPDFIEKIITGRLKELLHDSDEKEISSFPVEHETPINLYKVFRRYVSGNGKHDNEKIINQKLDVNNKIQGLREQGFTYKEMRLAGVNLDQMRLANVSTKDLIHAGFSNKDLGLTKKQYDEVYNEHDISDQFFVDFKGNHDLHTTRSDRNIVAEIYINYLVEHYELERLSDKDISEFVYEYNFVKVDNIDEEVRTSFLDMIDIPQEYDSQFKTILVKLILMKISIIIAENNDKNFNNVYSSLTSRYSGAISYTSNHSVQCPFQLIYIWAHSTMGVDIDMIRYKTVLESTILSWNSLYRSYKNNPGGYHMEELASIGFKPGLYEIHKGYLSIELDIYRENFGTSAGNRRGTKALRPYMFLNSSWKYHNHKIHYNGNLLSKYLEKYEPELLDLRIIENMVKFLNLNKIKYDKDLLTKKLQEYNNISKSCVDFNKKYLADIADLDHKYKEKNTRILIKSIVPLSIAAITSLGLTLWYVFNHGLFLAICKKIFPTLITLSGMPILHILLFTVAIAFLAFAITTVSVNRSQLISVKPDYVKKPSTEIKNTEAILKMAGVEYDCGQKSSLTIPQ